MSSRPVHGTCTILSSGGHWSRSEPARSAALYAQYWQQKATIFRSGTVMFICSTISEDA